LRHSSCIAQNQHKNGKTNFLTTAPAFLTIMAKKKKATSWEIAKPLLEENYLANRITDTMKPKDVVKLQLEYKDIEYHTFVCNFCNQKIVIKKLQAKAEATNVILKNERHLYPLAANPGKFPYPRWDGCRQQQTQDNEARGPPQDPLQI
jgi:hypothetical protein